MPVSEFGQFASQALHLLGITQQYVGNAGMPQGVKERMDMAGLAALCQSSIGVLRDLTELAGQPQGP
jgi:hypothetical protein